MALDKEELLVFLDVAKKYGGKTYGSYHIEKLKGGITYKIYYEMLSPEKKAEQPAYIKLIFPDKQELLLFPLTLLETALKKSNEVGMVRYEFEKKLPNTNYLYVAKVGKYYFDLPEDSAKKILASLKLNLTIYPQ